MSSRFRPRIKCRGRVTSRIACPKHRDETGMRHQSISECEKCSSAVKILKTGVECKYIHRPKQLRVG